MRVGIIRVSERETEIGSEIESPVRLDEQNEEGKREEMSEAGKGWGCAGRIARLDAGERQDGWSCTLKEEKDGMERAREKFGMESQGARGCSRTATEKRRKERPSGLVKRVAAATKKRKVPHGRRGGREEGASKWQR